MGNHGPSVSCCGILTSLFGITEMNERIKELVRQAGLTQAKDFKSGDEVKNFVFGNGLEKFAELIVAECLMKAIGAKIRGESIDTLIQNIKEDFGVEE